VPDDPTPRLADLFPLRDLAASLPRPGGWRPWPAASDRAAWQALPDAVRGPMLASLTPYRGGPDRPWPQLTASGYARYARDGDRQSYQQPYFARRTRLAAALLALGLHGPESAAGPSLADEVADGVWLLCEETSWTVPPHESPTQARGGALPDPALPCVELFSAETAALLGCADLLAGEQLDALDPLLRRRLRSEVRRRVLEPYREQDHWWWFGLHRRDLNNWTPWIHSNLLITSLLLDEHSADVLRTVSRTLAALDRYLAALPADGGCDEGIAYWWKGPACLFECLETLRSALCGEDFGAFTHPVLRAAARYPLAAHIAGPWHVNFADGSALPRETFPPLLHAYGRAVGDAEVQRHARALRGPDQPPVAFTPTVSLPRLLRALFDTGWQRAQPTGFPYPGTTWLPAVQVLTARERPGTPSGLFLAAKGGHNAEQHNHNDVGSFIVALNGRPMLVDAGVGTYTRQTFSEDRYRLWTMQSSWHNLPEIAGHPQRPGPEARATDVTAELSDAPALSLDLAAAYPPEAGVRAWHRELRLERRPTGRITVLDAWALDTARPLTLHLLTSQPVSMSAPGVLRLGGPGPALAVRYDAQAFDCQLDERPLDDPLLSEAWGPVLRRIRLTLREARAKGAGLLEITATAPVGQPR
jgi:hypothetical protein